MYILSHSRTHTLTHARTHSQDADAREQLDKQLPLYAPDYGLDNLTFLSFMCQEGFKTQHAAPDAVYAVAALLEANHTLEASVGWKEKFYRALDALQMDRSADSERK